MSLSYVVYKDLGLVVSTGSDCLSWSEIKACQDLTKTDFDFNPEFNQIVDLRAVTTFCMTTEQARLLAQRMIFSVKSKRALVAPRPAVFGMARMWEIFTELSDHPSQVKVFSDLSAGLQWLGLAGLPVSIV